MSADTPSAAPRRLATDEVLAAHLARRPDVDVVADGLATGGDLHAEVEVAIGEIAALVEMGVTHVLDVREEWSDQELVAHHAPQITYVHLGVDDAGQRLPDAWFDAGLAVAADAEAAGGLLLAHCHMGVNRGPSMAFAVLLERGIEPVTALDAIRTARPVAAVGYAADALDHHHRRHGVDADRRAHERNQVDEWFARNRLDVRAIVRGIRTAKGGTTWR